MLITDEGFEFFATEQSPGNRLPNSEIALLVCACKTLESFDNRGAALWAGSKWLAVGHVIIRMKMLCFADDFFSEMANISHECVSGKFAMLDLTQAKFPFASELRACQFGHRVFQKRDRLDRLRSWLQFLSLSGQVVGRNQGLDDSCASGRCSEPFLFHC